MRTRTDTYKHRGMRKSLVGVLVEKGIKNKVVLDAIGKIPRHYFFDDVFIEHAYQDKAFPIGAGQTISQPYTVAFQSELLDIKPGDKVLEIGTGSGYQSCVLLEMGAKVYTIEFQKALYQETRRVLPNMGYDAHFFQGDGSKGLIHQAPFDKIIVTAGAPVVPKELIQQLNVNGILVIPVGNEKKQKMLKIIKISDSKISKEEHDYFSFVPLLGESGWKA